jgi:hypothetical protein
LILSPPTIKVASNKAGAAGVTSTNGSLTAKEDRASSAGGRRLTGPSAVFTAFSPSQDLSLWPDQRTERMAKGKKHRRLPGVIYLMGRSADQLYEVGREMKKRPVLRQAIERIAQGLREEADELKPGGALEFADGLVDMERLGREEIAEIARYHVNRLPERSPWRARFMDISMLDHAEAVERYDDRTAETGHEPDPPVWLLKQREEEAAREAEEAMILAVPAELRPFLLEAAEEAVEYIPSRPDYPDPVELLAAAKALVISIEAEGDEGDKEVVVPITGALAMAVHFCVTDAGDKVHEAAAATAASGPDKRESIANAIEVLEFWADAAVRIKAATGVIG